MTAHHSAFAKAAAADFDWERIFKNAGWFHFTGITPALNDNLAEMCLAAVKAAKKLGVKISCDTNYRSKLWGLEKASAVMTGAYAIRGRLHNQPRGRKGFIRNNIR